MEEVRIQNNDRTVSFRVAEAAGEFIVFDMSLTSPTRNRTTYSGTNFQDAWKAVESIIGETAIPNEFKKHATS
ncbi:hypothetical protein [Paenibacillus monticola]|uniref:Uncharacterized protein n=1 Tax=Paenibacillus monticola TaxID=2666075 RepID=A0A7X2H2W1_9BACL|nr:hypothetical protein [Paenibacillus monticola]MRN52562.1 hypothetical protein [Paenibacillus monticola]